MVFPLCYALEHSIFLYCGITLKNYYILKCITIKALMESLMEGSYKILSNFRTTWSLVESYRN